MNRSLSLALAAVALLSADASGQTAASTPRSSTRGFFAGLALNGSAIKFEGDDNETESGGGLTLQLGYGFTPKFSMFLEGTGTAINPSDDNAEMYSMGHFDFGARYSFANQARKLVPFLEVALTARALVQEDVTITDPDTGTPTTDDLSLSGGGFSFGGGLHYFFNPKLALSTGLKWTTGEFSTVTFGNSSLSGFEADAVTSRFNIGLTWFPRGGR